MFENLSAIRNFCEIHHKEIEEMSSLLHLVTKWDNKPNEK